MYPTTFVKDRVRNHSAFSLSYWKLKHPKISISLFFGCAASPSFFHPFHSYWFPSTSFKFKPSRLRNVLVYQLFFYSKFHTKIVSLSLFHSTLPNVAKLTKERNFPIFQCRKGALTLSDFDCCRHSI